jgi:hypothetical protein
MSIMGRTRSSGELQVKNRVGWKRGSLREAGEVGEVGEAERGWGLMWRQ